MKNKEKYPNTADALEAYRTWLKEAAIGSGIPFDYWLECEYEEPREPTLLEAAKRMLIAYVNDWQLKGMKTIECMENLREAVKRENQKPVRNCDRYATAEEARKAFDEICVGAYCDECQFNAVNDGNYRCQIKWLYAEADAAGEEAK